MVSSNSECSAENRATCRYHGEAARFAPPTNAEAARIKLDLASVRMVTATGTKAFQEAEAQRVAARKQYLSVPSVVRENKLKSKVYLTRGDLPRSLATYKDYVDGSVQQFENDEIYRRKVFTVKAREGELVSKDLVHLAGGAKRVRVVGDDLFVEGRGTGAPFLSVSQGKLYGYNYENKKYELSSEEGEKLTAFVARLRTEEKNTSLMKGYTAQVKAYADAQGLKTSSVKDELTPVREVTLRRQNNGIAAVYRVSNGIIQDGVVGTADGYKVVDRQQLLTRIASEDSSRFPVYNLKGWHPLAL